MRLGDSVLRLARFGPGLALILRAIFFTSFQAVLKFLVSMNIRSSRILYQVHENRKFMHQNGIKMSSKWHQKKGR
jgi:hypothetical protein